MGKTTAVAHPNIAFIKYWGRTDEALNLPANPSISMNLGALTTVVAVEFLPDLPSDVVTVGDEAVVGLALDRVVTHLDRVRSLAGMRDRAQVTSLSSFPEGTGLASSASAFAALSLAATWAAGLELDEAALSRLARLGSGSACRSVPSGFSLWEGKDGEASFARQVAPPEHWNLCDLIAIVSYRHKTVGSYNGHALAWTSPLHQARLAAVPGLLAEVRSAIEKRDLAAMGPAVEADALAMHAVMMTSRPSLFYWLPETVAVLRMVRACREEGLSVYFTIDAGPNVHCLCEPTGAAEVERRLRNLSGVLDVLVSGPGSGVRLAEVHLS
jgi:diphosphomevalonate decarboxylase